MKSLMNLVALGRPIGFPSIINVHKGERGTLGAHPPRVLFRYPEWCNRQIRTGSIADAKCGRPRNRCADCVLLVDQTGVQREREHCHIIVRTATSRARHAHTGWCFSNECVSTCLLRSSWYIMLHTSDGIEQGWDTRDWRQYLGQVSIFSTDRIDSIFRRE